MQALQQCNLLHPHFVLPVVLRFASFAWSLLLYHLDLAALRCQQPKKKFLCGLSFLSLLKAEKLIKESEIDGDNADYFERVAGEADRRELEDASEWLTPRTRIHDARSGGGPNRRLF